MRELTIKHFHRALEKKRITCYDLVKFYLKRIDRYDKRGPKLNAIVSLNEEALDQASALDTYYANHGLIGPLHGVVVLVKDNVDVKGMVTTAGSLSFGDYQAQQDADLVKRLKEAGAIIIAKTNLHEFAIWGETISSVLGQTLNPYDMTRTPGGSSGGTGAAVAADFGMVGIGTDTINSIRSPASANSLVGIRPTQGLVSKEGIVPYSNTQDAAGPICKSVEDAARVLEVITGHSYQDRFVKKGKRIGVLRDFFGGESVHQGVNNLMEDLLMSIGSQNDLYDVEGVFDTNRLVGQVSVHLYELKDHLNAYLSTKALGVSTIDDILASGLYHEGIKDNLIKANLLSTSSKDYKKRLLAREETKKRLLQVMDDHDLDVLLYPHQKQLVCKIGQSQVDRNGVLASVTGFPALCLPAGYIGSPEAPLGVPVGVELLARPNDEGLLIQIAYGIEQLLLVRQPPDLRRQNE